MKGYATNGEHHTAPVLADAERSVKELEDLEDYYFGADKDSKMLKAFDSAAACVDRVLLDPSIARQQALKSRALYLKGRASGLVPGKDRLAEEHLSKAIKLHPQLLDAWNALGEVYWNMQDIAQAQHCFEQALELCGPNPVSLRNLSMALRAVDGSGPAAEGKAEDAAKARSRQQNYSKALEKAKEAVALGPEDPHNWETLGNAYVGNFFVNAKRPDEIKRALIAYEKGDAAYDKIGKRNPTLHFNRGMAAKYMEDYDLALRSFKKAQEIGAAAAAEEGRKVWELVERLSEQTEKKCDLKVKRLKEVTSEFPSSDECRTLKDLQGGLRKTIPLVVRVTAVLDRPGEVPVIAICCDTHGEFFALSFYNTELQKLTKAIVPMKTLLSVQQAGFRQVSVTGPGNKRLTYASAAVANPADVSILSGGAAGVSGASLSLAAGRSMVYSTGADNRAPENEAPGTAGKKSKSNAQKDLVAAVREARERGEGQAAIIHAAVPCLRAIVEAEFPGASKRLQRVEAMLERLGNGEVLEDDNAEEGKRRVNGYIEGLAPCRAFHSHEELPWVAELQKHWTEIRDELNKHINNPDVWVPAAETASKKSVPDWKLCWLLSADVWEDQERFAVVLRILQRLKGVHLVEGFFDRLPPHSSASSHADSNYILTLHLALELEAGRSSLCVGKHERDWEEGEVMMFDPTFLHSAWNDSDRYRYVLVLRFWHPDLSAEERRALEHFHRSVASELGLRQ